MAPRSLVLAALGLAAAAGCAAPPRDGTPRPAAVSAPASPPPSLAAVTSLVTPYLVIPRLRVVPVALPPADVAVPASGTVTLHCRNADLREVIPKLARQLGRGIAVDARVHGRITLDLDGVTPHSAIRTLAFTLREDVYSLPGGTLVFERLGRGRWGAGAMPGQPLRTVLETLATRAGATLIVDESIDGNWPSAIPCEDPARALAEIALRSNLHAVRYGGVIAVSPRPLVGGDLDLDADKTWRAGLPVKAVSVDLRDPTATPEQILLAAQTAGGVPARLAVDSFARSSSIVFAPSAPWTDLVALVARLERMRVRRDGEGVVLESPVSVGLVMCGERAGDPAPVDARRLRGQARRRLAAPSRHAQRSAPVRGARGLARGARGARGSGGRRAGRLAH